MNHFNRFATSSLIAKQNAALVAAFCFLLGASFTLRAQAPSIPATPLPATAPPAAAGALYASIADKPAIVYDAPSAKAQKQFIFARNQPVEVLVRLDKWAKIRDADNTVGWVEITSLGNTRAVQVAANLAEVRAAPNASAPIVFEAQRAVLLEVTGPGKDGWLPVRHRDGQSGFVLRTQIWGD
jgi:SH3-like domain-containing protein